MERKPRLVPPRRCEVPLDSWPCSWSQHARWSFAASTLITTWCQVMARIYAIMQVISTAVTRFSTRSGMLVHIHYNDQPFQPTLAREVTGSVRRLDRPPTCLRHRVLTWMCSQMTQGEIVQSSPVIAGFQKSQVSSRWIELRPYEHA